MRRLRALLVFGLCLTATASLAAAVSPKLERVVIVMRHGVRPPTKSAQALAPLSDRPWPDDAAWGAGPGELTPHGAEAIRRFAVALRQFYAGQGLLPARGPLAARTLIWADGADERTRDTAKALAEGLEPGAPPPRASGPQGETDPLFDALGSKGCALDPARALEAVSARGSLDTARTGAGLRRLQQIIAPEACHGGAGVCLSGPSTMSGETQGVKISGPMAAGATLAENLLLEYENGLPKHELGWGRLAPSDIATVMAVHDRTADLTRATPYIAARRAGPLVRFILAALLDRSPPPGAPTPSPSQRLIVLTGHDTNLSNLAGVFGLSWTLPGQPDATAPGTALAFERWRNPVTGAAEVRVRVFYQTLDQVRDLATETPPPIPATPSLCPLRDGVCTLDALADAVERAIPPGCGSAKAAMN